MYVDITISFTENQFMNYDSTIMKRNIEKLIESSKMCEIDNIIIGYEPTEDIDIKIFEIKQCFKM